MNAVADLLHLIGLGAEDLVALGKSLGGCEFMRLEHAKTNIDDAEFLHRLHQLHNRQAVAMFGGHRGKRFVRAVRVAGAEILGEEGKHQRLAVLGAQGSERFLEIVDSPACRSISFAMIAIDHEGSDDSMSVLSVRRGERISHRRIPPLAVGPVVERGDKRHYELAGTVASDNGQWFGHSMRSRFLASSLAEIGDKERRHHGMVFPRGDDRRKRLENRLALAWVAPYRLELKGHRQRFVIPAAGHCRQRLLQIAGMIRSPHFDDERLGSRSAEFPQADFDAPQRLLRQGPLPPKDARARQRPVDNARRRRPARLRMRDRRPGDGLPGRSAPADDEQPCPFRRSPEVGRIEELPFDVIIQGPQGIDPGREDFPLLRLERFVVAAKGGPVFELSHVFNDEPLRPEHFCPARHTPSRGPPLIVDRFAATGVAVKDAFGTSHEQLEPLAMKVARIDEVDRGAEVANVGMVQSMRAYRGVPVIDGECHGHLAAVFSTCSTTSRTTKQVYSSELRH